MFKDILIYLDGKKAIIAGLLHATNAYLTATGVIDSTTGAFIASIILILTGIGVQASNNILGRAVRVK